MVSCGPVQPATVMQDGGLYSVPRDQGAIDLASRELYTQQLAIGQSISIAGKA
jgi:hypothetical protein